jgi:xylulose-5-phosphate/fructose-6-phosphate phosphoketolase
MHPVWLDIDEAREHCSRGASVWKWAGNDDGKTPDIVLACAGDVATEETVAAAWLFRKYLPEAKIRVVNVVDLMTLFTHNRHPHGFDDDYFAELFTEDKDVVFAFHGYPGAVHQVLHGRPNPDRFHVRGYVEEGTTTTPFDMLVLNRTSRYDLCIEALRRLPRYRERARELIKMSNEALDDHRKYVVEHLEDMPAVRDWKWSPN